jgi:hypothetical protein
MLQRASRLWIESRLPFGCSNTRQRPGGANPQIAGGNDMKPPDDKIPKELRNRVLEQMPWLNNPNNPIPIDDPADIRVLWQQSKDLEAQPRQPGTMRILEVKPDVRP